MNPHTAKRIALSAAVAVSLFLSARVMANFQDGLVVYYPFEGDSNQITDKSGEENHGDLRTATRDPEGMFGKAIRFDTVADGAETKDSASYLITEQDEGFTCSFWVYPEKLDFAGENRAVFRRKQFNLDLLKGNGRLEVHVAGSWMQSGEGPVLKQGKWYFVAGTWSQKNGLKRIRARSAKLGTRATPCISEAFPSSN